MAYRYDSDLAFLKQLSSNDLKDLFDALVYDEDGTLRMNEELTNSTEYKRYGHDYAKYPERIAEELQCYGGNTFINFFRDEGVLYKEILCDACDHLKVSYNEKSSISLIEQNMLSKLLKGSLEKMSGREIKELGHELDMTNIDKVIGENKQLLIASVLTLFRMGGLQILSISFNCCKRRDKGDFSKRVVSRGKCRSYKRAKHFNGSYWLGHYGRVSEHQSCWAGL